MQRNANVSTRGRIPTAQSRIPALLHLGPGTTGIIRVEEEFERAQCNVVTLAELLCLPRRGDGGGCVIRGPDGFDVELGLRERLILSGEEIRGNSVRLADGAILLLQDGIVGFRLLVEDDIGNLEEERSDSFACLATRSPDIARLTHTLRRLATSDDILLLGETGTGKEVYARTLHLRSGRKGSFVALDCGAIPKELAESELFGYQRGAHSQATSQKAGLVREADGGTLFLDELGNMPPEIQSKLLRVVETREYMALGATKPSRVDIRVIAATSRGEESLREDLLHRLGDPIKIPPLRERREDIPVFVNHFLRHALVKTLEPAALLALIRYPWSGNVRQLKKTLERGSRLAETDGKWTIDLSHLPEKIADWRPGPSKTSEPGQAIEGEGSLAEGAHAHPRRPRPSREELQALLLQHRGNVSSMARDLARDRPLLLRWLRELDLDPKEHR